MVQREIKQWITVKGVHVPIFEGQTKEEAIKAKFQPGSEKAIPRFKNGDTSKVFKDDYRYRVIRIDSKGREKDYGWLNGSDIKPMIKLGEMHYEVLEGTKEGLWVSHYVKYMYDITPEGGFDDPPEDKYNTKLTEILGEKEDVNAADQLYFCMRMKNNIINPEFDNDRLYKVNCALCTTALALQARGYNVEAMPRDSVWRGFSNVFDIDYSDFNNYMLSNSAAPLAGAPRIFETTNKSEKYFLGYSYGGNRKVVKSNDIPVTPRGARAVSKAIIEKVRSWGSGSVGAIDVLWSDRGSAHSVAVINLGGNVIIFDAQSGRIRREEEFEDFFRRTSASSTCLVRLDNAVLKLDTATSESAKDKVIEDLSKMVKRRK